MGLTAKRSRKPRADSVLNRERLLEAATAIFAAGGPQASLEAVARRADVGIGTLYRHFPTRESLYEAVYRREVDQLVELAKQLQTQATPIEALRRWMQSGVEFMATKKGMAAALALAAHSSSELIAYSLDRLTSALRQLLQRAASAGELRAEVDAEDLLRTLVGMCYAQDRPAWQAKVLQLVDIFIEGLRRPPNNRRGRQAHRTAKHR